ncbi:hypothetical protein OAP32_00290 [Crocinitomicaceae bacterium]|nr:hypothetical protein [Crocinitomicaceae bacterium]
MEGLIVLLWSLIDFVVDNFWPILIVSFIIGLVTRKSGDGCLDTISSGCGAIIGGIFIIIVLLLILGYCAN